MCLHGRVVESFRNRTQSEHFPYDEEANVSLTLEMACGT